MAMPAPAARVTRSPASRGLYLGQPELLDRPLAQLELLDLAGHGHRELAHHFNVARHLVVGDLALAELGHGLAVELGAAARDDPGHQLLAVLRVGHADD